MKRGMTGVATFAFAMVLATTAFAQGRHDEKPHGAPAKAKDNAMQYAPVPVSGGRHDERPHGPRKPLTVSRDTQGVSESAPTVDSCCK
jgi:hypothetical protein